MAPSTFYKTQERIERFRNDPVCNYYYDMFRYIAERTVPRYYFDGTRITPVPNPEIQKLQDELDHYVKSKYSDLTK